jgi:hypothetical protein
MLDLFPGRGKSLPNERNPILFCDRSEWIMSTGPVERSRAILEHLLDQMLPAPEKEVGHLAMVLDETAQLLFHPVIPIFENLLELIENDHHIPAVFCGDLRGRLQDFLQGGSEPAVFRNSEAHLRLSFLVNRDTGREIAEEAPASLEKLSHR